MIIFFLSRNGNWLRAALVILVILVAASVIESYRQDRQRRLIYSHTTQTRAVGFLAGREAVLFHDKPPDITHAAKGGPYYYSMGPFFQRSGIRRVEHHGLDDNFRNRCPLTKRSADHRAGKECVSPSTSRGTPDKYT